MTKVVLAVLAVLDVLPFELRAPSARALLAHCAEKIHDLDRSQNAAQLDEFWARMRQGVDLKDNDQVAETEGQSVAGSH